MKNMITTAILSIAILFANAQTDSIEHNLLDQELERMSTEIAQPEPEPATELELKQGTVTLAPDTAIIAKKDTVRIRLGNKSVEIISGNDNTYVEIERAEDFNKQWRNNDEENKCTDKKPKTRKRKFDGHWASFDFGGNQLLKPDYSNYPDGTPNFLETMPHKSFEVNWNFYEYSFGFNSYMGIVTGLGLNFNDYKFKNRYTLIKDANGMIQPFEVQENDFKLSKLSTSYLHAPLLLEFQIPGHNNNQRLFIAAGIIGGLKLGDHTKTKVGNEKIKDKSDHNVSALRYGYTARVGFDNFGLYATYYQTPLFEKDKGPETLPLTVGVTLTF